MTNERILIVDDDKEIVRLVRSYLEQSGYEIQTAYGGREALAVMRHAPPDLLLLDLMLPDLSGWDVTKAIRNNERLADTPIIMLTAKVESTDTILGLELGADDYITKPFNPREVVARVRAMLRRHQRIWESGAQSALAVGDLRMDIGAYVVSLDGQALDLTRTEFSLLQVLMQNVGFVFTRSELIEKALGYSHESIERTLDTHIKNLRRKIGDDPRKPRYIQTVYGVGYKLVDR